MNRLTLPAFGLFCNPESRRVEGFYGAVARLLRQRPLLVPWFRVLTGDDWQQTLAPAPEFLRLESPGRNWPVEKLLLLRGAAVKEPEPAAAWRTLPAAEIAHWPNDPGRIVPLRQWFLGWSDLLNSLDSWAARHGLASRWLCPPEDVRCMYDKAACQQRLERAGLPVPPALGLPRNFDELWEMMRRTGRRRVFLKPCHGSSASAVVALETVRNRIQAFSTLELVDTADGLLLYNRRRIRAWRGWTAVRRLVDAACRERCLAQVWIPKAGLLGHPFDLRVVVIRGRARHVMVRLGRGPMTNSQLLGGKGDPDLLRRRLGEEAWTRLLSLCEQVMASCFPRCLYAGLDVLVEPNLRSFRLLEVNAFGDLLPRLLHEGHDTYEWEVLSLHQP